MSPPFLFKFFYFLLGLNLIFKLEAYDLTVVGIMSYADGLGRIPIGLIDILRDDLAINFIPIEGVDCGSLNQETKKIIFDPNKAPARVSILTSPIFWSSNNLFYKHVPNSDIKIAYSMFESTCIPDRWAKILNAEFDAVVVPDPFLIQVYKNCGVIIPIFFIPIGMYLDDFLQEEVHSASFCPFVFGVSAAYSPRKNLSLVIQAFAEEFGNSDEVILKIHGRLGNVEPFKELVRNLNISNVVFSTDALTQDKYIELMKSFDCYVNLSKGEGFSCCPREALALGIPCILSNNTAQKIICESGFVRSVSSKIKEPAVYGIEYYDSHDMGSHFNCDLADVKAALRDVYTNYERYFELASLGRKWVAQYSWQKLKLKYFKLG